ncbi:MAG: glycosyltransferase family 4 protein, partial [Planctomycetota bacterium]|nr:glycosyltransferase family 4 protein [Planctomycetota bacterium]
GKQLRRQAADLGIADRVIFAGRRTDIPDLLRLVDVLVHPSETESFGRTIAEAMACEKPVVGFRVGAVGELISDGQTGILIEPFDTEAMAEATVRLLKDENLRRLMGEAGRERALRLYDLKTNIAAMVDVIEQVAEGA